MKNELMLAYAQEIATKYHEGQYRIGNGLPYIVHPANVVNNLKVFGRDDADTLAVAWLHDTVEDTPMTCDEIRDIFGPKVAEGVYFITREGSDYEGYIKKLEGAPDNIKMIKICDIIDNLRTLDVLKPASIERKIRECHAYFIPWAEQICPAAARSIRQYLREYSYKVA